MHPRRRGPYPTRLELHPTVPDHSAVIVVRPHSFLLYVACAKLWGEKFFWGCILSYGCEPVETPRVAVVTFGRLEGVACDRLLGSTNALPPTLG